MKEESTLSTATRFSPIQLKDAKIKLQLYLNKLVTQNGPHTKLQKICHLASETFLKFSDHDQFSKDVLQRIKVVIVDKKCYYGLYLLDILIKNNKALMKLCKKEIEKDFKIIFQKVSSEPKNSIKIESLKAMARTWGVIYGQKYEENIRKWLESRFKENLNLSDRNQELFKQSYEKYKANNSRTNTSGSNLEMLLSQMNQEDNLPNLKLLEALKD